MYTIVTLSIFVVLCCFCSWTHNLPLTHKQAAFFCSVLIWVQANSPTPAHPRDNSRSHTHKKTASRQTHTLNPSSLFSFQQQINKTEQSRPPGWIIFITVLLGPLVLPLKTHTTCWASVSENPRCVAGSHKGSQCRSLLVQGSP